MQLLTTCKSCRADIPVKSSAATRPELIMEKGENFSIQCPSCASHQEKHVNDVRARINQMILLGGVALGVIATIILWIFYGAIGAVSMAIPTLIWKQQSDAVSAFNRYLGRR